MRDQFFLNLLLNSIIFLVLKQIFEPVSYYIVYFVGDTKEF